MKDESFLLRRIVIRDSLLKCGAIGKIAIIRYEFVNDMYLIVRMWLADGKL